MAKNQKDRAGESARVVIDTGGPPCEEAQADGVPCDEIGTDCEDCEKAHPEDGES